MIIKIVWFSLVSIRFVLENFSFLSVFYLYLVACCSASRLGQLFEGTSMDVTTNAPFILTSDPGPSTSSLVIPTDLLNFLCAPLTWLVILAIFTGEIFILAILVVYCYISYCIFILRLSFIEIVLPYQVVLQKVWRLGVCLFHSSICGCCCSSGYWDGIDLLFKGTIQIFNESIWYHFMLIFESVPSPLLTKEDVCLVCKGGIKSCALCLVC